LIAVTYLGSGSEGNSALIEFGEARYLLDVGLSARRIKQFLTSRCIEAASLSGIILTHEHADHYRGLQNLLKSVPIPVLTTEQTRRALVHRGVSIPAFVPLLPGQELERDGVRLRPFRLPHDAADPIGIRAEWKGHSIAVASDLGQITPALLDHVSGADILCIESNYDPDMLRACAYPDWLKRRVSGPRGHLPNGESGKILSRLDKPLGNLILIHLSQESNTPSLAWQSLAPFLGLSNMLDCKLTLATQHQPTSRIFTEEPAPHLLVRPLPKKKAIQHRFNFDSQEPDPKCMSTY